MYQEKFYAEVKQYLDKRGVLCCNREDDIFLFKLEMYGMIKCCSAIMEVMSNKIDLIIYLPVSTLVDARHQTTEMIARINHEISSGSFGMDYEDGEVYYRAVILCDGENLPAEKLIDKIFDSGEALVSVFGKPLISVMLGYSESVEKTFRETFEVLKK